MKKLKSLCLSLLVAGAAFAGHANAQDLVWSESFTGPDGPLADRATEVNGPNFPTGNALDAFGSISIASNALVITGDTNRDTIVFQSTAAAMAGNFTFDLAYSLNDTDPSTPETDETVFLQIVDGPTRSSGGSPVPNFAANINSNTLATPATFNLYFNVTGSDLNYTGPDGSAQTLSDGAIDFWRDSTLILDDNPGTVHTAGFPTGGVDSLVMNTFDQTGTEGSFPTWTIDNASLNVLGSTMPALKGDVDLSGTVGFLDINPFIARLAAGQFQAEADCNCDGEVTFLDIQPFIEILANP